MTDENEREENTSDSSFETPRPSQSSSNKPFDPKKMEEEIRKAKEDAIPRMVVSSPGGTYAPGKGPHITKPAPKPTFIQKNKRRIGLGGIILAIIAVLSLSITVFGLPMVYDTIFPPQSEINVTDLNAQGGIIEGSKLIYSYKPQSYTPNGTKTEIFSLKISNTGNANANNFWIVMDSKPDGLWFDFNNSAILHEGISTPCPQKSSYCTLGFIPKESNNMSIEYRITFDHKLYQEIVDETPKLLFNYGFDEGEEQTIEVQLKFD